MTDEIQVNIEKEIEDIFYPMVKVRSDTNTVHEKKMEYFFMDFFGQLDYFRKNKELYGNYPIKGDSLNRSVFWGLVKGDGADTIVLINHNDVVDIEDFKTLKAYAYSPRELEVQLQKIKGKLSAEVQEDLGSGQYIFGRGTADMKAGASIQLSLLKRYSSMKNVKGNILFLSVPDEENISAGMRSAVELLDNLKQKFHLHYVITINSEPHQRIDKDTGIIYEGSVGKLMPFIYVRGSLSHAGKVFEGFNPVSLLSIIINKTNLNLELSDFIPGEASPPPTWLSIRDSKTHYDVSMPLSACGYLSVLTLNKEPSEVLTKIKETCHEAFVELIEDMNVKYKIFAERKNKSFAPLPWEAKVVTYKELYDEAYDNYGSKFLKDYKLILEEAERKVKAGERSIADVNFYLVEEIYNYIDDLAPRVVIGLAPPYYPNVSNINIKNLKDRCKDISRKIMDFSREIFGQPYIKENYFTGISDLSYTYIENADAVASSLEGNMPLYGALYSIPLDKIQNISMPCLNIGPMGKDIHKLTERVLKEDLFYKTPRILHYVISLLLQWQRNY